MSMHPFSTMLEYVTNIVGPVYTEIGEMRSITPMSPSREVGNDSHLKSLNAYFTFMRAMKDPGDLPFVLLFSEANMTIVMTLLNKLPNQPNDQFRITLPLLAGQATAAKLGGYGILTELAMSEGSYNSTDPYTLACSIKKSGEWTFTPATLEP